MRVAVVTMSFPAPYETPATLNVATFARMGIEIFVYTLLPKRDDAARLTAERGLEKVPQFHLNFRAALAGVRFGVLNPKKAISLLSWTYKSTRAKPRTFIKSLFLVPAALAIVGELIASPPDVVHLNLGHYPSLVGFLVLNYLPQVVLSMSLGAYDMLRRYGGSSYVAQRADFLRVLAKTNIDFVSQTYQVPKGQITVIYDGVDLRQAALATRNQAKVRERVLTASKLVGGKGVDTTLRVFQKTLRRVPNATLHVLGEGPERMHLEALSLELGISAAVTFRGHVSHEEVFNEMARAEVFLFMSRYPPERLPNVVKEAVACRCLCVVSDTLGIEELVTPNLDAYIVAPDDVERAAKSVTHALKHENERRNMTEAAFTHLTEVFAVEKVADQYHTHWQRLRQQKDAALQRAERP